MTRMMKRILSGALSFMITLSTASGAYAENILEKEHVSQQKSYFDFEASEYEISEEKETLDIRVLRHGSKNGEVNVSFKVADFLADYGVDYDVLDEVGNPLAKVDGKKPSLSDFEFDNGKADITTPSAITKEKDTLKKKEELEVSNLSVQEQPEIEEIVETKTEEQSKQENVTIPKERKSTGSPLRDAYNQYLNIDVPEEEVKTTTESAIKETFNDIYNYFRSAEGAKGVLKFKDGEESKTIRVRLYDNNLSHSDKLFMLALMGADNPNVVIATNPTTYVTIKDNEEYETPNFEFATTSLSLSKEEPSAYLTVKRTSGTQYFSSVMVSTVKQTALEKSYEGFQDKAVAFLPGETEKKVKVTAYDFSENTNFGVRLEGEGEITIGNHYVDVQISSDEISGAVSVSAAYPSEQSIMFRQASGNESFRTLGQKSTVVALRSVPGGWGSDIKQRGTTHYDVSSWINNGNNLFLSAYTNGAGVSWITKEKHNFAGIRGVDFSLIVDGDGGGNSFITWVELSKKREFDGSDKSFSHRGLTGGWRNYTLSTSGAYDDYYIKFMTKPTWGGRHNPLATLGSPFTYVWAEYTFSPQQSVESIYRNIYDFSEGTPLIYPTYFDGEKDVLFNPGTVEVKTDAGLVNKFFANAKETVRISAKETERNEKNGIYLKGVYFTSNGKSADDLYNRDRKKYNTKNTYYVPANSATHEVIVKPDQEFIRTLVSRGVLPVGETADTSIKIYPVFEQETVTVNFENADRDDSKPETKGKFDKENKNSYISNVLEAHEKGFLTKLKYMQWLDFYSVKVPRDSVIRVKGIAKNSRVLNGIAYWYWGENPQLAYYKEGAKRFSGTNPSGEPISESDYTKADIVAKKNLTIAPSSGKQSFYIGYSPRTVKHLPKEISTLEGAIVNVTSGELGETSNKEGSLQVKDPYIGKNYTFSVFAPEGYYTAWANMTGDANNDGIVDIVEGRNGYGKTSNPMELYGNRLNVLLDQDNTRYYYEFRKKSGETTLTKNGTVLKDKNTFYGLANGLPSSGSEAVAAAHLDIGGFRGQTDGFGRYSIDLKGLPPWGYAGVALNANGKDYNQTVRLERELETRLPAFEGFKAKAIQASYKQNKASVAENYITIEDDELSITASVEPLSNLRPEKVKFYLYDKNGQLKLSCDEHKDKYKTEIVGPIGRNNEYRATLKFNPKADMKLGDKVYLEFIDQNGKVYSRIDSGYSFFKELDLKEFTFPLLGSSSLGNVRHSGFVTDILGDPLGDLSLGTISGFETSGEKYTPQGIPESDKTANTWYRHSYKFGWDTSFGGKKSWDNSGDKDSKDTKKNDAPKNKGLQRKGAMTKSQQKAALNKLKNGKISGKQPSDGKYQTKGSFRWKVSPSVGFNLTLSTRSDGKQYFEDLTFYLRVGFNVHSLNVITLPIGVNIIIGANLTGDITGVYYMYTDYLGDPYERKTVPYTVEDFGVFKKFNNNVRREGYLFLNPKIGISLGVGYGIISVQGTASFDFDMDFQFKETETNAYGDVAIDLGWKISLVGFDVYSKKITGTKERLFNTPEQHGHIEFDFENPQASAYRAALSYLNPDEEAELVLTLPAAASYFYDVDGQDGWNGEAMPLSSDGSGETKEARIQSNTGDDLQVSLNELSGGRMLMVYIGHARERNAVNKRALYYSIGKDNSWSEPKLVDDDGTLDDYPSVYDLGDKLLISWSSAEKEFEEGANLQAVLRSLNIKAAFFNKDASEPEQVEQLTKTTSLDFSSDVLPRAAYDEDTGQLMLYYTKTEYPKNLKVMKDIANVFSVTAYLFYDDQNHKWRNTGDDYTNAELEGVKNKDEYRKELYGQRFLDLRTNTSSQQDTDNYVRVVDSTAISYNHLGLFAWTVDNDSNLATSNDRDVFMQIYNFKEKKFTHIIRMTPETGTYAKPKFARSNNATYLFFGSKDGEGTHGKINYLNVSDIISKQKYQKVQNGNHKYYELKETVGGQTITLEDGGVETIAPKTVKIEPKVATESDNIADYDIQVTDEGKLYLFWTDTVRHGKGISREVLASIYNGTNEAEDEIAEDIEHTNEVMPNSSWSEPLVLTSADAGEYYRGIGVSVLDNRIYIGAEKGEYRNQNFTGERTIRDESSSLVIVTHSPTSRLQLADLRVSDKQLGEGSNLITLKAIVKNEGMLSTELPDEGKEDTVNFKVNGESVGSSKIVRSVAGGEGIELSIDVSLEDIQETIEFSANLNGGDDVKVSKTFKSNMTLNVTDHKITHSSAKEYSPERYFYTAVVENRSSSVSEEILLRATVGETEIGTKKIAPLQPGESVEVELPLEMNDSLYEIENGMGLAEIRVEVSSADQNVGVYTDTFEKQFDAQALKLLEGIRVVGDDYTMSIGEDVDIQPAIQGASEGKLLVEWIRSSDDRVASINASNRIVSHQKGIVELEGIVVPNLEKVEVDGLGNSVVKDWKTSIPEDKLVKVKVNLEVRSSSREKKDRDSNIIHKEIVPQELPKVEPPKPVEEKVEEKAKEGSFTDVSEKDWYHSSVKYVIKKGLFKGTSEKEFSPKSKLTRAMLVAVLYRAENMPQTAAKNMFKDVSSKAYYADAVKWASENGIVFGDANASFRPNAPISREEMAAIIFRYAKFKEKAQLEGLEIVPDYKDVDTVSDWAKEALVFCKHNKLMEGNENNEFKSKDNATRAETASVMHRLFENLIEQQ